MSGAGNRFDVDLENLYNPYSNRIFKVFNPRTKKTRRVTMRPLSILLKPAPGFEKVTKASMKAETAARRNGSTEKATKIITAGSQEKAHIDKNLCQGRHSKPRANSSMERTSRDNGSKRHNKRKIQLAKELLRSYEKKRKVRALEFSPEPGCSYGFTDVKNKHKSAQGTVPISPPTGGVPYRKSLGGGSGNEASTSHKVHPDQTGAAAGTPMNHVPLGMNSSQQPTSHIAAQQSGIERKYSEFLVKTEELKRMAFQLNDAVLMNKMFDVESFVAGKVMALRCSDFYVQPVAQAHGAADAE